MSEEKVSNTEFYFYKDLDKAFLTVIEEVKRNRANRENIFAHIMYLTKQDGKKDVVVFAAKSDDKDGNRNRVFDVNPEERRRQVEEKGLKKVYTLQDDPEVDFEQIYFRQVYDGTIPVEPLNMAYRGSRTVSNFLHLSEYKDCSDIECIRQKPKCDNKSFFVDNAIKFSNESDKPHTNMFCRQYGIIEISDELNSIANYDEFIARLETEYKINPVIASEIEDKLRTLGNDNCQEFLGRYRLKHVSLSEEEKKVAFEIADHSDSYVEFKTRMNRYILGSTPELRATGNRIKNYFKYMGSDQIKGFINQLGVDIDKLYMQEKDRMTQMKQFSIKEPSLLELTFSIGQKISKQMSGVFESGRGAMRNIRKTVSPYYEGLVRRGQRMFSSRAEDRGDVLERRRRQTGAREVEPEERRQPGERRQTGAREVEPEENYE